MIVDGQKRGLIAVCRDLSAIYSLDLRHGHIF